MIRGPRSHRLVAVLTLVVLTVSAFVTLMVVPPPSRAALPAPAATSSATHNEGAIVFDDNFTQDEFLNDTLWQINGPVGTAVGKADVGAGATTVTLEPAFSSSGMQIAQVNGLNEEGTIQSINSFSPPFNATAVVEGSESNGHTFGFAIASTATQSGVVVYGNLNPENCSHLGDCGDPSVCGTPANPSIAPNQCFYGINAKSENVGGSSPQFVVLYLTPSVDVTYTIEISVNASGNASFSVSEAGQLLGSSSAQIGTGPFYVVMEQAEGSPVEGAGPNTAYWDSVTVASPLPPSTLPVYPTESSYTNITLNYKDEILFPRISVRVAEREDLPKGLNVTLREKGETDFNSSLEILWNPSWTSDIEVNVTLDCVVGKCDQPGGTDLPMNYTVTIQSTCGSYEQNNDLVLQLLKAKWLVMFYSASDGELQDDMKENVIEMANASQDYHNPAVGMLVLFYAYTSTDFQNASQPGGSIFLYKLVNGSIDQVGGAWPETNIKDPATLHKFLNLSMSMEPADRNQLILSDHGGGIEGFGTYEDSSMNVTQLASAFDGIPELDIVSFDACLMAQVEVLYQLRDDASYFTASERTVPEGGFNYTGFLDSLLQDPDQTTGTYLNEIVSSYAVKYATPEGEEAEVIPTLAAIDSGKLDGVVQWLDYLAGDLDHSYEEHNVAFNKTMLGVIDDTVRVDDSFPYFDIRSFAESILATPEITNQSIREAATELITNVKEAVIANTTTAEMYEGLSVLLLPDANFPKEPYQFFTEFESQLSFSNSADWLPLMQDINRSQPGGATWTLLELLHPGHQLYLGVYSPTGGHTGFNSSLLSTSREAIEVIPGSYYFDFNDGTELIVLPSGMQNFRVVVDGTYMTEPTESYTLSYTVVRNGTVTSTDAVQGNINQYAIQSTSVSIQNGILVIGTTTSTSSTSTSSTSTSSTTSTVTSTSTASTTSSTSTLSATSTLTSTSIVSTTTTTASRSSSSTTSSGSATSSIVSTTSSSSTSSTSSPSSGSPITTYALAGALVVVIVVMIAILTRRRAAKS